MEKRKLLQLQLVMACAIMTLYEDVKPPKTVGGETKRRR